MLSQKSQRNRKSCYRRRGELFSCYPEKNIVNESFLILMIESSAKWPKETHFRLNLDPLETFKLQNQSKQSLWDFLGMILIYILIC